MEMDNIDSKERYELLTQIAEMYYKEGKTQTEIAKIMGITQVQVSRIEKRVLENMRVKLAI